MKPPSTNTDCHLLPEMVDDAMGQLANQPASLRSAVPQELRPAWPLEPGSLSEAVYWYRRSAGLGDAPGPAQVAASLSNLGYAWCGQRRWAEAEAAFRESLQLRQQQGDRAGVGQTFCDLGALFQAQQRWTDAEPVLVQGLAIVRAIGDRRSEANALGNLGAIYAALGQAEKATRHLQEALAAAREIADETLAKRMSKRLSCLNGSKP